MSEEGKKGPAKKKCPTAQKRIKQDEKRNLRNRSFKSSVKTAIRSFESALTSKDSEKMQTALSAVYSLMDRGVKQGVYKKNKAGTRQTTHVFNTKKRLSFTIIDQASPGLHPIWDIRQLCKHQAKQTRCFCFPLPQMDHSCLIPL